ncbi:glycosyl hydrolases family 32 superfamily [Fusarium mundagurra]|uniref:Glycosyl hydrolases family 32 superfamily n=1 Tax=Fusarium mundagurra TaxID=1567541 RepID=A0A8H6DDG5_9HYPO|nr:glycosyl hydrolases family 32 superfamily [Fusarium mundagurra]
MATLDSPILVQLPSKHHVYETVIYAAPYSTPSTTSQNDVLHVQDPLAITEGLETQNENAHRRWRPRYHLMPPTGWLNDPCAPGYDAVHDVYHVGFQWNPKKAEWGDISWGSAHSKDLVSWDVSGSPSIKPSKKHDGEAGVFTGCWSPVPSALGRSTAFYTSARRLPIHHLLPYNWGSEAICIATSDDAGHTWQRGNLPTVLDGPPRHLDVTGWRDPYVANWPSLSRAIGDRSDQALFGIVSGGVRGIGPAIFLYSLEEYDLTAWNFLSVLTIAPASRMECSSQWEPDYGANWEVVNFISLSDPDDPAISHEVLMIGVEGRKQVDVESYGRHRHSEFRRDHGQMWVSGPLAQTSAGIQIQFRSGGALDYGAIYAVNSFHDPKSNQQVAFGWIVEEDLSAELKGAQGWAGLLSVPRVVQLSRTHHVVHALKSDLTAIKSFDVVPEDKPHFLFPTDSPQTYTITTLCALPDPRLKKLRQNKRFLGPITYHALPEALGSLEFPLGCSCWELNVCFDIGNNVQSIGFIIGHTKDAELRTIVSFSPDLEKLTIMRAKSTNMTDICVADEEAPHTLLSTLSPRTATRAETPLSQEPLQLNVYFDVSCLELFANERTAITTRVYPESMTCYNIQPFVVKKSELPWSGQLLECTAWELQTSGNGV